MKRRRRQENVDPRRTPDSPTPPHTLRLLQLIRSGDAAYAQRAVECLARSMQQQHANAPLSWDLLGRLSALLAAPEWATRQVAAQAMYVVASSVAFGDGTDEDDGFFIGGNDARNKEEEYDDTLTVHDLVPSTTTTTTEGGGIDRVLAAPGGALYAAPAARYEPPEKNSQDDDPSSAATTTHRVRQRRHWMQRLGSRVPPMMSAGLLLRTTMEIGLDNYDDWEEEDEEDYAEQVHAAVTPEPPHPHSLRALLLRAAAPSSQKKEPQKKQLLASVLLYRMFDPLWYVRHGALLGILALLRAWRTANLGTHDLLAHCLCLLALDRFGDFAGGNVPDPSSSSSSSSSSFWITLSSSSSSVVAPVREICGQVVAVLYAMAPPAMALATRQVLWHLCAHPEAWEVRHGALIALKYIVVMQTRRLWPELQRPRGTMDDDDDDALRTAIGALAMERLADPSDDVKSEAAHVWMELCGDDVAEQPECHWDEVVPPLWAALQKVRPVSSCIVDLVALWTLLVHRNCAAVLRTMARTLEIGDPPGPIPAMMQFLVQLLDSDFASVRLSALRSIGVVVSELNHTTGAASTAKPWDKDGSFPMLSRTLQEVATRIVHLFRPSPSMERGAETLPMNLLQATWSHISDACILLLNTEDRAVLEVVLLSWFFGDAPLQGADDAEEDANYAALVQSANALAYFLSGSALDMSDVTLAALLVFLRSLSPWQCESACLLYRALAMRLGRQASLLDTFEQTLHLDMVLPCISFSEECNSTNDGVALLAEGTAGTISKSLEAHAHFWKRLLRRNSISPKDSARTIRAFTSMRVSATLAGAVLVQGIPSKVSPLVRILVTFFNNECVSRSRAALVAEYFTELLEFLVSDPKFERAYRKVLDTVCNAVTYRSLGGTLNEFRKNLAATILRSFVKSRCQMETFRNFPSFWLRLLPITILQEVPCDESASILDAMDLLEVLIPVMTLEKYDFRELIDLCTPCLLDLALSSTCLITRERAVASMVGLLEISSCHLLHVAVPLLTQELQNRRDNQRRFSACKVVKQLVVASGTDFSAYVRTLLPLVLSRMTDNMAECAQCATATFGLLVKLAPLVRQVPLENESSSGAHHESVIDHLIFGKPLPSYEFPEELSNSLRDQNIVLRNYQKEGISWLQFLQSVNLSGALCDDMGTGKSIQALLAIALAHYNCKNRCKRTRNCSRSVETEAPARSLIVCPSTLVGHWDGEIKKCFPPRTIFTTLCLTGSRANRIEKWIHKSDCVNVIITSYAVLRSDIDYLGLEKWCFCVLDEGHLLKNPKTATAVASRRLSAEHRLVLTGTLIQNRIHELWATFDFLMPGFLGTSKAFIKNFANPILRSQLPTASASDIADGMTKLKQLHQQVLPFILRREKNQVLSELPPMTQSVVRVPMSGAQNRIYDDFCAEKSSQLLVHNMEKSLLDPSNPDLRMSADALKSLLFLRLLCTHPSLVLTNQQLAKCPSVYRTVNASGKLLALVELLRTALQYEDDTIGADGDPSLLYCDNALEDQDNYLETLDIQDPCLGDMVSFQCDLRQTAAARTSKCLIFAQFTKSLDAVEDIVLKVLMPSVKYVRLDGSVSLEKRTHIVDLFQRDPMIKILLLTTRVGGLGLNLTSANTVIFLEIDFNPYADLQAQDRCMRIGQTKQVNVYRIITKDSIEDKILELQRKKFLVAETVVNNENSTLYSMGTDRLLDVFAPEGHNDSSTSDPGMKLEYDLEGLVEQCPIDYKNLSVDVFARTFDKSETADCIGTKN